MTACSYPDPRHKLACRPWPRMGWLAIAAALPLALASAQAAAQEWPIAAPAEMGFAPDLAERLDAALDGPIGEGLHAVLVVRGGHLVYERYLTGDDEIYGRPKQGVVFGPELLHDVRSITKSVVSLLYGIALADGTVPAPGDLLWPALPAYADLAADPARAGLTIDHILAMTMGTEWNEDAPYEGAENAEIAMTEAPDSVRFALDRPMVTEPGAAWTYNGGATTVAAALIADGNGGDLLAFAEERLFAPLGFGEVTWLSDYYGVPYAASGLRLRPRDTIKLGQLVLNGGSWNGTEIVPAEWIAAATSRQTEASDGCHYGYHWWLCPTGSGVRVIEGSGYGGQQLLIVPELDLVLLSHAGLYGDYSAWQRGYALLEEIVIPAILP